jgi:dTDP-glucose pyrophosphorylase
MTNVVVPMAGAGSRFVEAGYDIPKFLLDVKGRPMIQRAVWGCDIGGKHIYIVQKSHSDKYKLRELLPTLMPLLECVVIEVDGPTEGAAASALLAKHFIDNDDLLVICDSDGIVDWLANHFLREVGEGRDLDGAIATFPAEGDRWSYVELNEKNLVSRVAEKDPISDKGCAGIYYWRYGSDFVKYAEQMIANDTRVNGEFYIAPVYNEAIKAGKKIGTYDVDSYVSLGTPADYEKYLNDGAKKP